MLNQVMSKGKLSGRFPAGAELARTCFYGTVILTLALTLLPFSGPAFALSDKVEHFVGFLILTFLGIGAFGKQRFLRLTLALVGFGAMIELLQAIPFIGRDGEVSDWIADIAGVVAALTIVRLRFLFYPSVSNS